MTVLALFGDRNFVPALHVALASTLASWPAAEPLRLHLFHRQLTAADLHLLDKTVRLANKPAVFNEAEFDTARVRHWRSLYGSHMPYGRLFLARLLPDESEVLYLDADVIVDIDIRKLYVPYGENDLAAAMPAWDFAHSHDSQLAEELGIASHEQYFHSGLLILRLERWRREQVLDRCLELGDRFATRLRSHDQTLLNLVCHDRIAGIPLDLTSHLYPTKSTDAGYPAESIRNFCGSPKPFDPLGNVLNEHYDLFNRWLARTAIAGWSPNDVHQLTHFRRNLRLLKPMASTAAKMLLKVAGRVRSKGSPRR
jgi:lipopolysaccharide biosynthesis glycosyltransferase